MSVQPVTDQLTFISPVGRYPSISPPEQSQSVPGLEAEMVPVPDIGEQSYRRSADALGR